MSTDNPNDNAGAASASPAAAFGLETPPAPEDDGAKDYTAVHEEMQPLQAAAMAKGKAILFATLKAHGIALINVNFDGYGDSGQIEEVTVLNGNNETAGFPTAEITVPEVDLEMAFAPSTDSPTGEAFNGYRIISRELTMTPEAFVETLCFRLLRKTHGGWEDNEGSFGTFVFDVEEQTISLECSERYLETRYSEYTF